MKVFIFICVHEWETNTRARLKLYEMSTSYLRWPVFQFSTCMSLLRHGCQRHSIWISKDDSQMYTFPDQMNWQFVQIMASKLRSKLCVLDTDDVKQRRLCFCSGEKPFGIVTWVLSFYLRHLCPVDEVNAQTPITAILSTHLLHEFIVNVNCKIDWSYRKPVDNSSFLELIGHPV